MKNVMLALALVVALSGHVEDSHTVGIIGVKLWGHRILEVHEGSPADLAGLKAQDVIKKVVNDDSKSTEISGKPDTSVFLIVQRKIYDEKTHKRVNILLNFRITRVPWQTLNNKDIERYYSGK